MIMSYLSERKQAVYINGNTSDTLLTGPYSVSQGSILSGNFYLIYTLDMNLQTHKVKHTNHTEYNNCNNTQINTYIEDSYGIVKETNKGLWNDIKEFINININENNDYLK